MPVNLSVKNVPDEIARHLRERAARNHRSLQGELMAIVEAAAIEGAERLTPLDVLARIREAGISSPAEAVKAIREDRDHGHSRDRRG